MHSKFLTPILARRNPLISNRVRVVQIVHIDAQIQTSEEAQVDICTSFPAYADITTALMFEERNNGR